MRLTPRAESWATILADGDTAIFRNLVPGRVYNVEAEYRLQVSVGIPRVVDLELNGQPLNIVDPESGRISRVKINQMNLAEIMKGPPEPEESPAQSVPDVSIESSAPQQPTADTSQASSSEEAGDA